MSQLIERTCRHCQGPFVPRHHNQWMCSPECREARNREIIQRCGAAHYQLHRAEYIRRHQQWQSENPGAMKVYRDRSRQKRKAEDRRLYKAWVDRNRDRLNALVRDRKRRNTAIAWGKSNPVFREDGFAFISILDGQNGRYYHAVPVGRPIAPRERVLALFVFEDGLWLVHAPYSVPPDSRDLSRRIIQGEQRLREKVQP